MTEPLSKSFGRQITELEEFLITNDTRLTPECEFARCVYTFVNEKGPLALNNPEISPESLKAGQAPYLAAVGFSVASGSCEMRPILAEAWDEGFSRLMSKDSFPIDHQTFAFRPLEVLGISLGATRISTVESGSKKSLEVVIKRLATLGTSSYWSSSIYALSANILGLSWILDSPQIQSMQLDELAFYRWRLSLNSATTSCVKDSERERHELDGEILRRAGLRSNDPLDCARTALIFLALRTAVSNCIESNISKTWEIGKERQDALKIIENLCRRFQLFANQLLIRHSDRSTLIITDEYDVQDALHALLKLHFEDVRKEDWTPSHGGKSARVDFRLKRERIIIEVKMTREGLGQKEVLKELIEDKELYRTHPDCGSLVCFVYDPTLRCGNPTALEDDLSIVDGDFRVTAIVSPRGI